MNMHPAIQNPVNMQAPLSAFSQCHSAIVTQLHALNTLPAMLSVVEQARQVAADTLSLFHHAVLEHHQEEESELFPAVLKSAEEGVEREWVQAMVERLTSEHRSLEAMWKHLEPAVQSAARGKPAQLDGALTEELVRAYLDHAFVEEQEFLPLCEKILGRKGEHMAALGLSLHIRHLPPPPGYI